MKLLGIETATEACSAGLWLDGEIIEQFEIAPRRHTERLLPMIDELLAGAELQLADLDGLAFGRGPGSFTGVRIATGVIQGLALAGDLPVVGVSSLAALAQSLTPVTSRVAVALDARMGEVYWGTYILDADGCMRLQGEEQVCDPALVPLPEGEGWQGAGSGWGSYPDALQSSLGDQVTGIIDDAWPRAAGLLPIAAADFAAGLTVRAGDARPVYLRNRVTHG